MNKQLLNLLSIIGAVAVALVIYLYFFRMGDKRIQPALIVPESAFLVLESSQSSNVLNDLKQLDIVKILQRNEDIADFMGQISMLDSLFKTTASGANWFESGEAVFSFHAFPNQTQGFFMAVQTKKEVQSKQIEKLVSRVYPGRFQLTRRKFSGNVVWDFNDFGGSQNFSVAWKSGLLLFSFDGSLVEQALYKLVNLNPENSNRESSQMLMNASRELSIYINYKIAPDFLRSISLDSSTSAIGNFAEKGFYEVESSDDELLLKGAAITSESDFQFLDLFNAQKPIENNMLDAYPSNTVYSMHFSINDYQKWIPNLNEYLYSIARFRTYETFKDSLEYLYQKGMYRKITGTIGSSFGLMALQENGIWQDSSRVVYFDLIDPNGFSRQMDEIRNIRKQKSIADSLEILASDTSSRIHPFYLADYPKVLFGDLFEGEQLNHYVIHDNRVYLSSHYQVLERLLQRMERGELLKENQLFKKLRKRMVQKSNIEMLVNADIAPRFMLGYLNEKWYGMVARNMAAYRKAGMIGIQFGGSIDKIFPAQIAFSFQEGKTDKTEKLWEINLDTLLLENPWSVYSPERSSQVVLALDAKNQLYMIDESGHILWKKGLEAPIISPVVEIDLFKNGKAQYLFNTSRYVYIIDESGKNIPGWPVWIPTSTEYPLCLTQLNEARDPGIFAVGRYYKLSAWNQQGLLIGPWNPLSIYPNIKSGLVAIEAEGKKQLVAFNEKGNFSRYSLSGNFLGTCWADSISYLKGLVYQKDTGNLQLVVSDSLAVYQLSWNPIHGITGKKMVLTKQAQGISRRNSAILVQTKNGNAVLDERGNIQFDISYADSLSGNLSWMPFPGTIKAIWYENNSMQLNAAWATKRKTEPFPLPSSGKFLAGDIFHNQENYLLNAMGSNLMLYRIK
ncbi:MAG: hypothetical protein L6Q78_07165 [Bacteroidia bacterium]|nr:hypothetical protein [Bacteroidia bacterium]